MKTGTDFDQVVRSESSHSFIGELWMLLRSKKKYWLMPIVVTLLMLGLLVFLSGTAAAPFIYTLF